MTYFAVALLVVAVLVVVFASARHRARKSSGAEPQADSVMIRKDPSADAPTPARSVVETPAQVRQAGKHTPPA